MNIQEAMEVVTNELKNDLDYRRSWEANIAMAFKDTWSWTLKENSDCVPSEMIHDISNRAARHFLAILCIDSEDHDDLPGMMALNKSIEDARKELLTSGDNMGMSYEQLIEALSEFSNHLAYFIACRRMDIEGDDSQEVMEKMRELHEALKKFNK